MSLLKNLVIGHGISNGRGLFFQDLGSRVISCFAAVTIVFCFLHCKQYIVVQAPFVTFGNEREPSASTLRIITRIF